MNILNLTQHPATPEQINAGVVDLTGTDLEELKELLTFDSIPSRQEIEQRADAVVRLANKAVPSSSAMIGGAPFFMSALESALMADFFRVLYAFSVRESVEETQPDGSIRKVNIFKHAGFVRNC